MTQAKKRILGIGRVVLDHVVELPEFPQCDTKCLVTDHWRQLGGPVPVALSTAQFYGTPTEFLGDWGEDADGQRIAQTLRERGVVTRYCVANGTTGFAQIWTEATTGKRTVASYPGSDLSTRGLERYRQAVADSQILHLDGTSLDVALPLAKQMRQQGGTVVLDAGSRKPGMEMLLPWVDVLIASDLFCRSWFGEDEVEAEKLLELECGAIVRTHGARGATYRDRQLALHEAAVSVPVVDTNGAGDIFSGAWLHGMAESWEPQRILAIANRVAGYACGHRGNSTLCSLEGLARK